MLSIIIPAHNESRMLESSVNQLTKAMAAAPLAGLGYEIVIAEDGSTDGTQGLAEKLARSDRRIRVLSTKKRIGRGFSLSNAITAAKGDIIIYMDADLATDLSHLPRLIREIGSGSDISTGSRLLAGSKVIGRRRLRDIASKGYNLLLRLLFRTKLKDHQCGFKSFRKSSVLPLLPQVRDGHWFWDSELLIRAQKAGLKVTEFPVEWADRRESSVKLQSDVLYMGAAAIRLRLSL